MVKITRDWGEDTTVDDSWHGKAKLAKHRLYLYWSDEKLFPADDFGFRLPHKYKSFKEKYDKSKSKKRIFCFGGSTTWGQYCKYTGTYPHFLEQLFDEKVEVFNFGGCDSDARTEIYLLIDLLRQNFVPDIAIFLDGINEKQAWFSIIHNRKKYEEINLHYPWFERLFYGNSEHFVEKNFFLKYIKRLFVILNKISPKNIKGHLKEENDNKYYEYVDELSMSYIKSFNTIKKIAKSWNIRTYHFLQPTVYDLLNENPNRHKHIKAFYNTVLSQLGDEVIDISKKTDIDPIMFIDWQHLNDDGNKKLAQSIYGILKKNGQLKY